MTNLLRVHMACLISLLVACMRSFFLLILSRNLISCVNAKFPPNDMLFYNLKSFFDNACRRDYMVSFSYTVCLDIGNLLKKFGVERTDVKEDLRLGMGPVAFIFILFIISRVEYLSDENCAFSGDYLGDVAVLNCFFISRSPWLFYLFFSEIVSFCACLLNFEILGILVVWAMSSTLERLVASACFLKALEKDFILSARPFWLIE